MSFVSRTFIYSNVRVEISIFETEEGIAEYHAMLHVLNPDDSFERQREDIQSAYFYLLSSFGGLVHPMFRKYFLSDAANQAESLRKGMIEYPACAVSVVQQPPLDGSKVALWVYLQSGDEAHRDGDSVLNEHNGYTHIWTGGMSVAGGDSAGQTTCLLEKYAAALGGYGTTLADNCVRTWFFVQNVDVNYSGVVEARKEFFAGQGLTEKTHYITSTGIEGRHADPEVLVQLDAYAVKGLVPGQQRYLYGASHLNPTYEYGVTFERGVYVEYGDRRQVYISGTASIDNRGEIVAPGDIEAQARRMLENVDVLLSEASVVKDDVAVVIVYLRDTADYNRVRTIFDERYPRTPRVITLAPVCRPGWLIEMECIAVAECSNPQYRPL